MAFVHAFTCAGVASGPDHLLAAGRQAGRARLSRDIRAPYDLNRSGPRRRTHACGRSVRAASWRSRLRERAGRREEAEDRDAVRRTCAVQPGAAAEAGGHVRACVPPRSVHPHASPHVPRSPLAAAGPRPWCEGTARWRCGGWRRTTRARRAEWRRRSPPLRAMGSGAQAPHQDTKSPTQQKLSKVSNCPAKSPGPVAESR